MSMKKEEWTKGIEAWTKVRDQAKIDIEQADLYLEAIKNKMDSMESEVKQNGK